MEGEDRDTEATYAELERVQRELREIRSKIRALKDQEEELSSYEQVLQLSVQEHVQQLEQEATHQRTQKDSNTDWGSNDPSVWSWSSEVDGTLRNVFGIGAFREAQRAVINATLSGRDCFLVMPTGGGKSLCYQLPAIVSSGLTLVVSPLLSLIHDQVLGLKALKIDAASLTSNNSKEEDNQIYQQLDGLAAKGGKKGAAGVTLRMLYITPEKIAKSKRLLGKLEKIYKEGRLSRIVIDEAHCCSQWGNDFRPDYKGLGVLKRQFPNTPVMALTATATDKVKSDVKEILRIPHCLMFRVPVNRVNLRYEVRRKGASREEVADEIADYIKTNHRKGSGIVYCFSKRDTEETAEDLVSRGIEAAPYHAYMEPRDKERVHTQWLKGRIQVIVATIAFGMGINKLDVRFVIHHSISKSLENYYQESGRAGRDGQPADCVLYYRGVDLTRQSTMVFAELSGLTKLYQMIEYCENYSECRRKLISRHFGETLDSPCGRHCDNCCQPGQPPQDVTSYCRDILEIVAHITGKDQRVTLLQLVDVWKGGAPRKKLVSIEVGEAPRSYSRLECERLVTRMLVQGILEENFQHTAYSTNSYLVTGPRAPMLRNGLLKVSLCMGRTEEKTADTQKPKQKEKPATPATKRPAPKSSSPPPQKAAKRSTAGVPVKCPSGDPLARALHELRMNLAKQLEIAAANILSDTDIKSIVAQQPMTGDDLSDLIGDEKADLGGPLILDLVRDMVTREDEEEEETVELKPKKRLKKTQIEISSESDFD